ncbi:MAG: NUDIX domain-containing protein [Alphaproteobacteria bacterium]|nr:MAG: NUDIX domain-containing protein [Alphaproteobacteria bacterium]
MICVAQPSLLYLAMETIDIFDEMYRPLNPPAATYDEVHQKGLWHHTFAGWLVNPENRTVLLQLRGPQNKVDPGTWDASGGGHLVSGERPTDGFRELHEELGVSVAEGDRFYLGIHRNVALLGAYINHEFCHVYLAPSTARPESFKLQAGEVDGVAEIGIEDGVELFSGKRDTIPATGIAWNGAVFARLSRNISRTDMCNYRDRCEVSKYYLKIMLAARGLLKGEKILVM